MNYYTFEPRWPYEKIREAIREAKKPKPLVEDTQFCDWVSPIDEEMDVEEQGMIQFAVLTKDEDEIVSKAKEAGYVVKHQYAYSDGSYYLWVAAEDKEKCEQELTTALGQPVHLALDDPQTDPWKIGSKTLKEYMDTPAAMEG